MTAVLDASAVLALLYGEAGHEIVAGLVDGSMSGAVTVTVDAAWADVDAGVDVLLIRGH